MKKDTASVKKPRRYRGYLCAAFAAAGLLSGCSFTVGTTTQAGPPPVSLPKNNPHLAYPVGSEPGVVDAFGVSASQVSMDITNWDAMLQRQQKYMLNAKDARSYNAYLATFNRFRGETLVQMADNVNSVVLGEIKYSDTLYPHDGYYFASPVQTVLARAGDCKEYATLQYEIMLHLGVPEDRLFVAMVNSEGQTSGTDHAVLLLNTAPTGQLQNFVVLNDGGPVINAIDYAAPGGANATWSKPYRFYDAINQSGVWATSLGLKSFTKAGNQAVSSAKSAPKMG